MRILVTGATGFVGSQLCRRLIALGHQVRAFHRPQSDLSALDGLSVEHALGDITEPETLPPAMEGIEAVFHTAAKLGKRRHPASQYAITVLGTRHVCQAALQAGVRRLVHTSSVAALGVPTEAPPGASPLLMDETHAFNFPPDWWPYGHAKHLAEQEIQEAVARGLDAVIVNPAVILGPGDVHCVSLRTVIQVAERRLPVAAPGGISVVHIDDVVQGHLAALEKGRTGERYILAGENLTIPAYLEIIAQTAGVSPPRLVLPAWLLRRLAPLGKQIERWFNLPFGTDALYKAGYYFYYDNGKATRELGLTSWHSAASAIRDAYAWYQTRPTPKCR